MAWSLGGQNQKRKPPDKERCIELIHPECDHLQKEILDLGQLVYIKELIPIIVVHFGRSWLSSPRLPVVAPKTFLDTPLAATSKLIFSVNSDTELEPPPNKFVVPKTNLDL